MRKDVSIKDVKTFRKVETVRQPERWNIQRAHLRTLFTHFKTNTKTIGIYQVLGCCVLFKQNLFTYEIGQANQRPQISTKNARSIHSISLVFHRCKCPANLAIWSHRQKLKDASALKKLVFFQKQINHFRPRETFSCEGLHRCQMYLLLK